MNKQQDEQIKTYAQIFNHNKLYLTEEELIKVENRLKNYDKKKGYLECLDEIIEEYKQSGKFNKKNEYYMSKVKRNRKMIIQMNVHGRVLKTFDSLSSAAEFLGNINYKSNISSVCAGRMHTYKGYKWAYID